MKLESADIRLVFAGSGHGKSYRIARLIKGQARLLIWDVMAEYSGAVVTERAELVRQLHKKRFKVAFRPDFRRGLAEDFDFFCRAAWAAGSLMVVVEELNQVTKPVYAPPAWQNLTSRGRHRGIRIIGASQRPASVDKDAIGNATEIHAGILPYERDRKALASQFGSGADALAGIEKTKFLVYRAGIGIENP